MNMDGNERVLVRAFARYFEQGGTLKRFCVLVRTGNAEKRDFP
jgi:hypothetical protein